MAEQKRIDRWVSEGRAALRHTWLALGFVWRAYPAFAVLFPILTLLAGPVPMVLLYCGKKIIDGVELWIRGGAVAARPLVVQFLALTLALRLLLRVLEGLKEYLEGLMRLRLSNYIQDLILARAVTLDMAFFETPSFYDKLQRAQREAGIRPYILLSSMVEGFSNLVNLTSSVVVLATLTAWTIPVLLVVTVPAFAIQVKYGRRGWHIVYNRTPEERRMSYYQYTLTSMREAKELRLFGLADHLIALWKNIFWMFYQQDQKLAAKRSVGQLGASVIQIAGSVGFYAYVVYRAVTDPLVTIGSLTMYVGAMSWAMSNLTNVMRSIAGFYENHLYLANLFEFLALRPQICAPARPRPVPAPMMNGVAFETVTFRYPNSEKTVLEDVCFEIKPGEKIAIVGENGAGKTTLVKLLARLYDPEKGRVTVDGVDLRELNPSAWQKQIGVIFQDFAHYAGTARENVGFGQLEYLNDMQRIRAAGDQSGATECIERLEHGWESQLSKWFDDGQELSFGEWQRVALARAFIRDARILVLDEPTASLDAKQEYEIFRRFEELTRGKTTILISHRFSTVRIADRILVIEKGRLVESGSHEELMTLGGRYAELFTRQAAAYR